jgi:alpha-1,3-glucan synthase
MLYTNENQSHTYEYPCKEENWISTPFISGDRIKNLIYPVCFFTFFSLL